MTGARTCKLDYLSDGLAQAGKNSRGVCGEGKRCLKIGSVSYGAGVNRCPAEGLTARRGAQITFLKPRRLSKRECSDASRALIDIEKLRNVIFAIAG